MYIRDTTAIYYVFKMLFAEYLTISDYFFKSLNFLLLLLGKLDLN